MGFKEDASQLRGRGGTPLECPGPPATFPPLKEQLVAAFCTPGAQLHLHPWSSAPPFTQSTYFPRQPLSVFSFPCSNCQGGSHLQGSHPVRGSPKMRASYLVQLRLRKGRFCPPLKVEAAVCRSLSGLFPSAGTLFSHCTLVSLENREQYTMPAPLSRASGSGSLG